MSVVRKFHPEVRLKRLLAASGGIRPQDALARAEQGLEDIRAHCLDAIDAKIEKIMNLAKDGEPGYLRQCYNVANEVFAEAGAFQLDELSAAAHSLCSLTSGPECDNIPVKAIIVHVDAMRALRTPAMASNRDLRRAVLAELRGLASRIATPHRAS